MGEGTLRQGTKWARQHCVSTAGTHYFLLYKVIRVIIPGDPEAVSWVERKGLKEVLKRGSSEDVSRVIRLFKENGSQGTSPLTCDPNDCEMHKDVKLLLKKLLFFAVCLFYSQVLEVVAGCRGEDVESLAQSVYENTLNLFFS